MTESIRLCTQMRLPDDVVKNADFSVANATPDGANGDINDANFDFGVGGRTALGKEILWKPGQIITIGFMGGTQEARSFTREHAERWLKYANIEFLWQGDGYHAMIRIAFDENRGTWSYVGTDCLLIPGDDQTMNLGRLQNSLDRDDLDDARYVVTHEFAHMLGMQHEQNHPESEIPWDKEAMYVARTYFDPMPPHPVNTPFDRHSIMIYPVDNQFTIGDFEVGYNYHISEGDAEFMRRAYPAPIPVGLRPSQA